MGYYVIIRGPAGAGKSTIAEGLSKHLNGCHISFDKVMRHHNLDTIKGECIKEHNFIKANEIVIPKAMDMLEEGKTVVFDGNFYHKSQIEHLIKHLPYPCFAFTLKATVEECICRDSKRNRPSKMGKRRIKDVYKLVSRFDYGTVIDTRGKTEKETIRGVLSRLPE